MPATESVPTISLTPPTSVETVAREHIIASMTVKGSPSEIDDKATTCPASAATRALGTRPSKVTASSSSKALTKSKSWAW